MTHSRLDLPALAASAALAFLVPAAAHAAGDWEWQATVYAYLPTISGDTTFPPPVGGQSASVDAGKILDNLKMTFMGALAARNGEWGVATDLIYFDLGNTKSGSRDLSLGGAELPAGVTGKIGFDMKTWLWTLAGTYRVVDEKAVTLDVLGGVRLLDVTQTLDWELAGNVATVPVGSRTGAREASLQNWDAIVGVAGRARLGADGRWFVPYELDVGTGESNFTWQAFAGLGYTFGWGDVFVVYRAIDYQMKSGRTIERLSTGGPAIAASFRW